ncbi:MAG: NADH-quinone oxidoreductase subunit C [Gemmataceae bacterium]|nr:NADH-quinone oxidoreductase subunit C [Gemmataceae bacterium]
MPSYEDTLKQRLGPDVFATQQFRDNHRLIVKSGQLHAVLEVLKHGCGFDMLIDVTAVDYLHYPDARDRFGVIYCLLNTTSGERTIVKTYLNEPELTLPTAFHLWKGADWMEREVYDMYGIVFEGHPDLRRILLPEEFTSFPLRKDYPAHGRGERHNFPVITRAES